MRKKLKIIIIAISLLVILIGATILKNRNMISVNDVEILNEKVIRTVSSSGIIKSRNSADLGFSTSGKVISINVVNGDKVHKGKTLAALSTVTQSQSTQAIKDARDIAIRNKEIFVENNEGADYSSNDYKLQIRKHDELISQAEANYKASLGVLRNFYITAPFDGTILEVNDKIGEIATIGTTVIKLADLNKIYFETELDQEDFAYVRKGQQATVKLDAYPNTQFPASVIKLSNYAKTDSSGSETFVIEIEISNVGNIKNHPILLNMNGDVDIVVEETQTPVQAINFDQINKDENGQYYLWKLDNGHITKLPIEIGIEGDLSTEVKTKLPKGTIVSLVITNGKKSTVKEGMKAKIVKVR